MRRKARIVIARLLGGAVELALTRNAFEVLRRCLNEVSSQLEVLDFNDRMGATRDVVRRLLALTEPGRETGKATQFGDNDFGLTLTVGECRICVNAMREAILNLWTCYHVQRLGASADEIRILIDELQVVCLKDTMVINRLSSGEFELIVNPRERRAIRGCLIEVCGGYRVPDFERHIGATEATAAELLQRLEYDDVGGKLVQRVAGDRRAAFSIEECRILLNAMKTTLSERPVGIRRSEVETRVGVTVGEVKAVITGLEQALSGASMRC